MNTLDVREAAALLHMNAKRVQSLARSGKLPAVRVGRRWLFHRDRLLALLGGAAGATAPGSITISARNRLRGTLSRIQVDGLMAEVELTIGDQRLVAIITRASVESMGLRVGDEALALVKSTEVMIGKEEAGT